ncbi:MAG: IMPACT family protein [Bacteroidota bacterium]|nr:IMPACT family protein [Bacteroidota bacterium]
MSDRLHYYTIEKPSMAEYKERGSKFIAYAYPVQSAVEFKKYLQLLKKEHTKAVHHCFAYRIGLVGDNFRVSDDGEPLGTAGKPILGQIDSKQLVNVLVVVVRYFGGTLLGVPGLINAYKTSTALALQLTPVVQKQVLINYHLQLDYTRMNDVMIILRQFGCEVIKQESQLFCSIEIGVPKARVNELEFKMKELQNVECKAAKN